MTSHIQSSGRCVQKPWSSLRPLAEGPHDVISCMQMYPIFSNKQLYQCSPSLFWEMPYCRYCHCTENEWDQVCDGAFADQTQLRRLWETWKFRETSNTGTGCAAGWWWGGLWMIWSWVTRPFRVGCFSNDRAENQLDKDHNEQQKMLEDLGGKGTLHFRCYIDAYEEWGPLSILVNPSLEWTAVENPPHGNWEKCAERKWCFSFAQPGRWFLATWITWYLLRFISVSHLFLYQRRKQPSCSTDLSCWFGTRCRPWFRRPTKP